MSGSEVERIERAALKHREKVYDLPPPARHHDIYKIAVRDESFTYADADEGFLTSSGRFVNRFEAAKIARAAGQAEPVGPLQTVDLW